MNELFHSLCGIFVIVVVKFTEVIIIIRNPKSIIIFYINLARKLFFGWVFIGKKLIKNVNNVIWLPLVLIPYYSI